MLIHPEGAKNYWEEKTWVPPAYENSNQEIEKLSRLALNHVNGSQDISILEMCCGKGDFTLEFLLGLENFSSYHCLDVNDESLALLKKNLGNHGFDVSKFRVSNAYIGNSSLTEILGQKFDIAICARAITHMPDIEVFFKEASSVLNEKGVLIADIVPADGRISLLKEKYGLAAYVMEGAYNIGKTLSRKGIARNFLTRSGLLRTINPSMEEMNLYLENSGMKIVQHELDSVNHYYRFAAMKV